MRRLEIYKHKAIAKLKTIALISALLLPTFALSQTIETWSYNDEITWSYSDGLVSMDERDFLVGELGGYHIGNSILVFHFQSSIWLRFFLSNDPTLFDHRISLQHTEGQTLAEDHVAWLALRGRNPNRPDCCALSLDTALGQQIADYQVYSEDGARLTLVPIDSDLTHVVQCRRRENSDEIVSCTSIVAYPHSDKILLVSHILSPGTFADYGPRIGGIVNRMYQFASCLDVTGLTGPSRPIGLSEISMFHPNLDGCDIETLG